MPKLYFFDSASESRERLRESLHLIAAMHLAQKQVCCVGNKVCVFHVLYNHVGMDAVYVA